MCIQTNKNNIYVWMETCLCL